MMQVFRINHKILLSFTILIIGLLISYAVFAQEGIPDGPTEEDIETSGITFPVPELGNCASKGECKKYCDNPENLDACIAFAKNHGLMNKEEAERAQNFSQTLRSGGGPGGCSSPRECETFCRNINNMEACIAFAEKNNIRDKHVDEGRRILNYIRGGGEMPGGCNTKESCEAYCGDFSHAEECFNFAKRAGISQGGESDDDHAPTPEQFERLAALVRNGETPGGCNSKDSCEAYCRSGEHFEECIAFGEKIGFVKPEEAAAFRRTGGKGPGGCNSRESCDTFCNNPTNREACFKFAEENGLIRPEEARDAREGLVRLRQGLENAPPEVQSCVRSVMGTNIIEDIQSGNVVPGPEVGERVRGCFEKHGGGDAHDPRRVFDDAPPEVISCIREKVGSDFEKVRSGEMFPTPEMGDTFRVCFSQSQGFREDEGRGESGFEGEGRVNRGGNSTDFLRTAPPGVAACLKEKLGDRFQAIQNGELQPGPELGEHMQACFESFRPEMPQGERPEFREEINQNNTPNHGGPGFPPQVLECVKTTLSPEAVQLLLRGDQPKPEMQEQLQKCYEGLRNILPQGGETMPAQPERVPTLQNPPTSYEQQYQDQYKQEFERQYQEQYQQQYQQLPSNPSQPTPETMPYNSYTPPIPESPPPSGGNLLNAILGPFIRIIAN